MKKLARKISNNCQENISAEIYFFIKAAEEVGFRGEIQRCSQRRCFVKKGALRNVAKFTGKHLCQSLFFQ